MNPEENEVKDERLQHQEEGVDDEVRLFLQAGAHARLKTGNSTLVFLHRPCFITMLLFIVSVKLTRWSRL